MQEPDSTVSGKCAGDFNYSTIRYQLEYVACGGISLWLAWSMLPRKILTSFAKEIFPKGMRLSQTRQGTWSKIPGKYMPVLPPMQSRWID